MTQRNTSGPLRKLALGSLLAGSGLALSGCSVEPPAIINRLLRMNVPQGVTPEAHQIGNFWVWVWVAAWIIGIIMWCLFLVAIFRWTAKRAKKQGKDEFPKQLQYNIPLELVLTTVPVVIVMVLFFFTVQTQQQVTALNKDPRVTVDVTAFQWNWKFGYAHVAPELNGGRDYTGRDEARQQAAEDSKYVRDADGELVEGQNPVHGTAERDLSYLHFDRIETVGTTEEVPVLVLPTNTPIEFNLASADVSHGFWIPEFLFKRDVYAHPEANQQERRFQVEEIEREGAFVGRCTEMCGTYHSMMNFELRAISPEKFAKYLQFRIQNPEAENSEALAHIGEEPYATSTHPFTGNRVNTRDGDNYTDYNETR